MVTETMSRAVLSARRWVQERNIRYLIVRTKTHIQYRTFGCLGADCSGTNLPSDPKRSCCGAVAAVAPRPAGGPDLAAQSIKDDTLGTGTFRRRHKRGAGVHATVDRSGSRVFSVRRFSCSDAFGDEREEAPSAVGVRRVSPAGRLAGSTPPTGATGSSSASTVCGFSDVNLLAKLNWTSSLLWLAFPCVHRIV